MDIEVNYKNKKRYKSRVKPMRQRGFWVWLIWLLSKMLLIGKKYKVEKEGMEGLKPPYMILSNHMEFIDFELLAMGTTPHPVNNVVSIDGYFGKFFLLEWVGAIMTRKFTVDVHLVKAIRNVLKRGDVLAMYPEARYTPCGTLAFLPDSLGKLVKMNKVPIVAAVHHGNHLHTPFWDFRRARKVPMVLKLKLILTPEQLETMTPAQINEVLRKELWYDEYQYQKDNNILIKEAYRAEGLHKVLYQCPHCGKEFTMDSKGAELFCTACGKRWLWQEDGYLKALEGETEFDHIPDWFEWERQQVVKQVEEGTYSFSEELEVHSLPRVYRYMHLGKAKLTHDRDNGFILEGFYRGQAYRIQRKPEQMNSLHVEYDFAHMKKRDAFEISTENDTLFCVPNQKNILTKLAFATEAIYMRSQANAASPFHKE